LYVLVIGSMLRARFWNAMLVDAFICALYGVSWVMLDNPPWPILVSLALALGAIVVFTLWGAYRLEYTHRAHWLMTQHERHLQRTLNEGIHRLDELSRFDALTGLPNRREFTSHLQKVWARAQRDGRPVAILLMDIDHFKLYNDSLGHVQGDTCLQQVAQALKETVHHPMGLAARWGGEEFIVVLNDADTQHATQAAQRVLNAVRALRLAHGASPTASWVTCSIGVASVPADASHLSPEAVIAAADEALYQAKARGRARWASHDPHSPFPNVQTSPTGSPPAPLATDTKLLHSRELALLDRPLNPLVFPSPLETKYQEETAAKRLKDFLLTGMLALVTFNVFLPTDYLMANDVWEEALQLRLFVFTPIWALVIAVCWFGRDALVRIFPSWVHETIVVISGVFAGGCLAYILAVSKSPLVQYYHVGMMVVLVYGNLVQRLRFWFALAFTTAILGMQVMGALMATGIDEQLLLPMIALGGSAGLFSLMANHGIDRDERKNYLMSLRRKSLLTRLQQVHQQLTSLARVDPLTGLYNRRHVNESLAQAWTQARADKASLAVVMIDIDHFKAYNDHCGHPQGDQCLQQVAQALAKSVRGPSDIVGRYGGEEFIAILTQVVPADAVQVAERMRTAIEKLGIAHTASPSGQTVTISVGVACLSATERQTADHLLQCADQALYQAKHRGRNAVVSVTAPIAPV
jgi:diguanylate cyclase (GGDEF)-like protein